MDKRNISITEALKELKLYDAKIFRATNDCTFIGARKKSSDKVGVVQEDKFIQLAKSGYQSVTDLIENRRALKSAIVQSNAVTTVEIGGIKYTVAEAIERKNSIGYDKALLNEMKVQYKKATDTVTKENNRVDTQVDKMLETFVGKDSDKKISETDLKAISDPYREKNEFVLVDPLNLLEEIQKLEAYIDNFEADVDVKLSISNSVTYIEV